MIKARPILATPNPILRKKAKLITNVNEQIIRIAREMVMTLVKYDHPFEVGAAIAAPQVGESIALIVIRKDFANARTKNHPKKDFLVIVNPKIVKQSEETNDDFEGCLSIPSMYGQVGRFSKITVEGKTLTNQELRISATGFKARVLQHEIDHLSGILFTDRISNPSKMHKMNEMGQLIKINE